jgi:chemotaxis protein MotC
LPPTLGAHIALVRGGLLMGVDAGQARRHLAMARLLAPGSLVEEAALRREASMVNILEEPDAFLSISRRYKQLYARSPFASNFWRAIANAFASSALTLAPEQRAEIEAIIVALPPPQRLDLHLAAARKAILNARLDLAQHFIGLSEALAQSVAEQRRLSLYRLALVAIGGASADALEQMRKLDAKALSAQDIELRNIVGAAVTRLQGVARTSGPAPSGLALPQAEPESRPAETAMSNSIRQALSDADMLLVKAATP